MPIVACEKCGARNRVDANAPAGRVAKCGKCGTTLAQPPASTTGNAPVIVTDASFSQQILGSSGVVLLDCWAPWCGPCRMIGPIMEQLATEADGRYLIAKLNVDDNPRTAAQFQIQSIPTMLLFKDGKLIDRLIGAQPKQAIAGRLMQAVSL
ncbi:MAG TPA: thioredoxin [Pyrinomonadaceae bacterium]|nr:thioredoxin [Pyrinomonadaceae bacterium]